MERTKKSEVESGLVRALRCSLLLMVLLCVSGQGAHRIGMVVGNDTLTTTVDDSLANILRYDLGYVVRKVPQGFMRDSSSSFWLNNFDGLLLTQYWSGIGSSYMSTYGSNLAAIAIPIVTLHRESYLPLKLAMNPVYISFSSGGYTTMRKRSTTHWITRTMPDTLFFTWSGGLSTGLFAWYNLAGGATNLYTRGRQTSPLWNDSTMMMVVDSGATLTVGTAPERRAMFAGFCPLELDGNIAPPGWCHWKTAFRRLCAWTFHDTANAYVNERACATHYEEVEFCWTELGDTIVGTKDGEYTYTSQRSGGDSDNPPTNYGKVLGFTKINNLARYVPNGYQVDSIRFIRPVIANDNATGGWSFTEYWRYVTQPTKWYCPCLTDNATQANYWAGVLDDSNWVNRFHISGVRFNAIPWDSADLGTTDYNATPFDSIYFDKDVRPPGTADTIIIPKAVCDLWLDSASNNGMIGKSVYWTGTASPNDVEVSHGDALESNSGTKIEIFMSRATVGDITPSIRMSAYMCGADGISADSVFLKQTGDDSTFFQRYENLIGLGQGMDSYAHQMWRYAPNGIKSFYTSPCDMPAGHSLPTDINLQRKYNFYTNTFSEVDERLYLHYWDETVSDGHTITGTYSAKADGTQLCNVVAADSISRAFHYTWWWGGNTYTYPTRPLFSFYNVMAENFVMTAFHWVILNDSNAAFFPAADTAYPTSLYFDNYIYRLQTTNVTSGGHITELPGYDCTLPRLSVANASADSEYQENMWTALRNTDTITIGSTGQKCRAQINVGSECDSCYNDDGQQIGIFPGGVYGYNGFLDTNEVGHVTLNFEFGFDLLQVKGQAGNWTLGELAQYDSIACARGITFMYCAAPWDRQARFYREGTWDYFGFSQAAWSLYMRMILYLATRSDSTMFYPMPDYYHGAYQGYAFDCPTLNAAGASWYDWTGDSVVTGDHTQSFDTLSWQECLTYDIGKPQGMPFLMADTSYHFPVGSDTWHGKVWKRWYQNGAFVLVRPYDHGDVGRWGAVADTSTGGTRDLTLNISLGDTCKVLLPDGTLSDSTYTTYPLNPADGFVFVPATGYTPPGNAVSMRISGTRLSGVRIRR